MSQNKVRVTGFARFLFFLIFVIPIAYIAASYYNGEDGLQKAKELIGLDGQANANNEEVKNINSSDVTELENCQKEVNRLKRTIELQDDKIVELEEKLKKM